MPDTTIELSKTIKVAGKDQNTLTIKEPTAGLLLNLEGIDLNMYGDGGVQIKDLGPTIHKLAQAVCNLTPSEVSSIPLLDLMEVAKAFFASLGLSGLIGNKPFG